MTKKDYELIAEHIKEAPKGVFNEFYREAFVCGLADKLKNDNPKFDRDKFLTACGIDTGCEHKRTSPAHDPDMRYCLDCDELVKRPVED